MYKWVFLQVSLCSTFSSGEFVFKEDVMDALHDVMEKQRIMFEERCQMFEECSIYHLTFESKGELDVHNKRYQFCCWTCLICFQTYQEADLHCCPEAGPD